MRRTIYRKKYERTWERMKENISHWLHVIFIEKSLLLYLVGFLLGRAVILFSVSPFAIAFLATVWVVWQRKIFPLLLFTIIGAWTYSPDQALFITISSSILFVLIRFTSKQRLLYVMSSFVFLSLALTRIIIFSFLNQLTAYEWLLLTIEGILGVVLLFIFMQCIPYLTRKMYQPALKNEEVISFIILIASALTGLIGWDLYGLSLVHIFSRYIVIVLAFIGGVTIGSTAGVVTGLILSLANVANLYQISLLAFSGLLAGLLQEAKKIGISIGMFVGTFLVGLYVEQEPFTIAFYESFTAIMLFLLTPKSWITIIARHLPGSEEYSLEERKYLQKIRDVTAQRVEQFSAVFAALSKSFFLSTRKSVDESSRETDYFLSIVTEKTCQHCFMKERCWQVHLNKTYTLMENMKEALLEEDKNERMKRLDFENHCVKSKRVLEVMEQEIAFLRINKQLKKQVMESKRLVADQLQGVSDVMEDFAKEIIQERKFYEKQEIQIIRALKQMNIYLDKLDIYRLEKGNVDIEMALIFNDYRGEGSKLIAPVLSDILEETIVVTKEEISPFPNSLSYVAFGSSKQYEIETGVAVAAQGGGLVSGDSHTMMELGKGKFALAISDGMGNGLRAREESMETLRLLQQILETGISEQVAIKSINSILALRTTDEIYATLDLAIINLYDASLRSLKVASAPSFIKRGDEVIQIHASNLPIGIVEHVEIDVVQETLKPEDILIMMSDGIIDGLRLVQNKEYWLKQKIRKIETNDPQAIADLLLEEVIRNERGVIRDDMTVVAAKIKRYQPEWAAIPYFYEEKTSS